MSGTNVIFNFGCTNALWRTNYNSIKRGFSTVKLTPWSSPPYDKELPTLNSRGPSDMSWPDDKWMSWTFRILNPSSAPATVWKEWKSAEFWPALDSVSGYSLPLLGMTTWWPVPSVGNGIYGSYYCDQGEGNNVATFVAINSLVNMCKS